MTHYQGTRRPRERVKVPTIGRPKIVEDGIEVSAYLPSRQVEEIEAHRVARGFASWSRALREIIQKGLEA